MTVYALYGSANPGAQPIDIFHADSQEDAARRCCLILDRDLALDGPVMTEYHFREVGKVESVWALYAPS